MKFSSIVLVLSALAQQSHAFTSPQILSRKTSSGITSSIILRDGNSDDSEVATPITLNPLVASVKISKTVEVFSLVKQMQAEGTDVTSLCVGEPDFPPPQAVLDAASQAILDCDTRYTAVTGTAALRNAIAEDLKTRKQTTYDPNTEIIVGNGAKQCVYQGILATCGPGDKVIVPAPFWPSYPEMVALAGAESVILPTQEKDGYLLTPEALRESLEACEGKAKLLIFCNPSNPTGGVHSKERLLELAEVLKDYPNVAILADEIYERLTYNEEGHTSFASLPGMFHRTLTVNGFSKAYAMTGMRLGYLAAPVHLAKAATTIQSQLTSCAGSISQAAGVAALKNVSESEMEANVQIMKEKRDYVIKRIEEMDHISLAVPPEGAFYVLPDVSKFYDGDDTQLCLDLLTEQQLALVPGSSFGADGTIRISYATSLEELELAMNKLEAFLKTKSPN